MTTITTRAGKGSPLTNTELDNNFTNLNTAKYESGNSVSLGTGTFSGLVTVNNTNYATGALRLSRNLDTAVYGAVAVKQGFGSIYNGAAVYPVEVVGGVDTDGTALYYQVLLDSTDKFKISPSSVVFNESGADTDFRVESDARSHMLFVDAGNDRVGVGEGNPVTTLHVKAPDQSVLQVEGTGSSGAYIRLRDADTTAGNYGWIGQDANTLKFFANNSIPLLGLNTTVAAFNENGYNVDFRVESDSNAHMLFVDAGNNRVRINQGGGQSTSDSLITEGSATINGFRIVRGQSWASWANNTNYYVFTANPGGNGQSGSANVEILASNILVTASFSVTTRNAGGTTHPSVYCTSSSTGALDLVGYRDNADPAKIHFYVRPTSGGGYTPRVNVTGSGSVWYDPSAPSTPVDVDFVWPSDTVYSYNLKTEKVSIGTSSMNQRLNVAGAIEAGTTTSVGGGVAMYHQYGAPNYIASWGAKYSSGGPTMNYGGYWSTQPSNGFYSTYANFSGSHASLLVDGADLRFYADNSNSNAGIDGAVSLYQYFTTGRNGTIVNEDSRDHDFRVESDSNANMLFVDAGENYVSIGTDGIGNADTFIVNTNGSLNGTNKFLAQFSDGSNTGIDGGVLIRSYHPRLALSDISAGGYFYDMRTDSTALKFSRGSKDDLFTRVQDNIFELNGVEAVFNQASHDRDFRVESNDQSYMLFVDAGTNKVGINTASPHKTLTIRETTTDAGTYWAQAIGGTSHLTGRAVGLAFDPEGYSNRNKVGIVVEGMGSGWSSGDMHFINKTFSGGDEAEATLADARLTIRHTGEVCVNDISSATGDFRVESDGRSHMLFVDGGGNIVHFNRSSFSETSAGASIRDDGLIQATRSSGDPLSLRRITSYGQMIAMRYGTSSTVVGSVDVSASGITYNTTSDRRLKDNIEPLTGGTDKLMAMNPVTHTWIARPEAGTVQGFIAQEMQEIVPEAVSGDPDGEEMMSMDYGRITPVLVAALQDAHKKIEALEERLAELEGK